MSLMQGMNSLITEMEEQAMFAQRQIDSLEEQLRKVIAERDVLKKGRGWISVNERLPINRDDVWVYWLNAENEPQVMMGWLSGNMSENIFQYWFGYDLETLYWKVLGWMPVDYPEPPESK